MRAHPGAGGHAAVTRAPPGDVTQPMATDLPRGGERPMRLCFVCGDYPVFSGGKSGGIGTHTYALVNAIASLGHDVTVIASAPTRETVADGGATLHGVPTGSRQWKLARFLPVSWIRWSFAANRALRAINASKPFELVVFPDAYGEGFRFALDPCIPFVVRFGGPATIYQRWDGRTVPPVRARAEALVERLPPSRAALTVCSSQPFAEYVSRDWGLDFSRFRFVRNPLDVRRFHPAAERSEPAEPLVLFAGRVQPLKGTGDLVDAIPSVLRAVPRARFRIVGNDTRTGPDRSSFRATLEQRLREAGVLDRVEFVETVAQSELIPMYQQCTLFVLPCRNDVYPNSVLEAMGCGRPCIVTSTTGVAELIGQADAGRVIPPASPEALGNAIIELLTLPTDARDDMGRRARRIVETLCAPEVIGNRALEVYREAIATWPAHRRAA